MKKRVFSLLLILALLMSLWVTAGAVDLNYKDNDEITYKEAVAVLSREGVITGFEDGTFRPKETLTRSQACTILTKILGGQPNGEADFTDVRPGSWYAGYVAYCAYNELVAGNGDGTFNPAGQLTGSAWSKMLLTGLGYDAEASGMLGRGWATGVAALASEESLYNDIENFDPDKPVTRDEACQIAYNAMFDGQVPEPPNNILARLSYSFSNTRGAFSYPNPYQIPMEIFRLVYGDEIKAQKMYEKFGNWGGNCYGMVSTAGILYQYGNGISPSDFNSLSATPGGLSVSDRSRSLSLSLTQFIEALHVSQLSEELNEVKYENWNDLNGLVAKVKEAGESGKAPVLICAWGPEGGHAIMGYDVEEVNSSESRVLVYDPNYPMDHCYITLTKSGGSYTGWSYPISYNMIWNDMNGAMSYIPYADYYQGWQNRKGSVITSDMLFMTVSDDAVIYDENGNRAAEVWNGKVNVYQENIYPMRNIGIVLDDNGLPSTEITIWLPGHSYSVKHSGSGEFTVELTEKTQTASVTTTASSVDLNVEDGSALRTVSIPSSEQGATYTIVVRSSMEEDGGAASIRLSGTVTDSGVTAGSDSGTLVTDGADPGRDTLYVDDRPIYEGEPEHGGDTASPINYYKVFNIDISSWDEAEEYCESLGGHLATLTSEEENDYVYLMMRNAGFTSAYFGLTDQDNEDIWTWITGEQVSYLNWHLDEPSNDNQNENYAMFYFKYSDGTWNDGDFGGQTENGGIAFICEWDTEDAYRSYLRSRNMTLNDITAYPDLTVRVCEESGGHNIDVNGTAYQNATLFDASLSARHTYELSEQYSRLTGCVFVPQIAQPGKDEWIKFYLDGKLVWSWDGLTNDDPPVGFDIDLSGASTLTIETGNEGSFSCGYLILADTQLTIF